MENQEKKVYQSPAIIFETDLETKAGSPLAVPGEKELELFPGSGE